MEIRHSSPIRPAVLFEDIKIGEVFGECSIPNRIEPCLKIEPVTNQDGEEGNIVSLDNGKIYFLYDHTPVIKITGAFVID